MSSTFSIPPVTRVRSQPSPFGKMRVWVRDRRRRTPPQTSQRAKAGDTGRL